MIDLSYDLTAGGGVDAPPASLTKSSIRGASMANNQLPLLGGDSQSCYHCKYCSQSKVRSEFYASSGRKCKECVKRAVRDRARTDPKVREYDRNRAKTPDRKAKAREITKRWREENPLGYTAHSAVSNAVRDGRLSKLPCEFCGDHRVHAHHKDYSKPLEVIWLCPKCHHRLHALFPEVEGANKS